MSLKIYLEAEHTKRVLAGVSDSLLDAAIDLASELHRTGDYNRAVQLEQWIDKLSLSGVSQTQMAALFSDFPELRTLRHA